MARRFGPLLSALRLAARAGGPRLNAHAALPSTSGRRDVDPNSRQVTGNRAPSWQPRHDARGQPRRHGHVDCHRGDEASTRRHRPEEQQNRGTATTQGRWRPKGTGHPLDVHSLDGADRVKGASRRYAIDIRRPLTRPTQQMLNKAKTESGPSANAATPC
jgi:hypothetical protein